MYDRLEPIGEWRADFRTSFLVTIITNITKSLWGKKGIKMSNVEDFMFRWGEAELEDEYYEPKKQTLEEMKQVIHAIHAAFKPRDKKKYNIVPKQRALPRSKRMK